MKLYKITMFLELNEDAGHPRKWVPEAIWDNLQDGEDIVEIQFDEVVDSPNGFIV